MKKIAILSLLGMLALTPGFSQASDYKAISANEVKGINGGGRRKKSGTYRKKKGFMWGIFKGKSQCGTGNIHHRKNKVIKNDMPKACRNNAQPGSQQA